MNSVINSNENSIFEFAKRSFYSFQVLIIGIAIPFLFLFGISNHSQKQVQENQVKEITNSTPSAAKPVIGLYIPII
ncbi:MAG: hypothetical protein ACRDE8_07015 [Ginsengibacter sp.]